MSTGVSDRSSGSGISPRQRLFFLRHNGSTPSTFLDTLDLITKDGEYERQLDPRGAPFGKNFPGYIRAAQPYGLGLASKSELLARLELPHREEQPPYRKQATVQRMQEMRERVRRLLDEELPKAAVNGGDRKTVQFRGPKLNGTDTRDRTLARLKRDAAGDPEAAELVEAVVKGEISAYAAARAKGWRPPRIYLRSPEQVAADLRRHISPEGIRKLARLLSEDGELM